MSKVCGRFFEILCASQKVQTLNTKIQQTIFLLPWALFSSMGILVWVEVPDLIPPFAAITHPAVPPPINFSKHESLKNNFEIL